jgi:type II secretory pathway pseudopilin PulG
MARWLGELTRVQQTDARNSRTGEALRDKRGLSLIETVVSLGILMMLLLTVVVMLTTSFRADTRNQERHVAAQLAQRVLERVIDFASQGTASFDALVPNYDQGALPAQPAIPGVRPAIPAEPPGDRISDDFDGDEVSDYGAGTKRIYVYQLLVDDIEVGGQTGLLKEIIVRVYYANQNAANPSVDLRRHPNPGGHRPRRYGAPLAEIATYVASP